jgi:hypothetical protein
VRQWKLELQKFADETGLKVACAIDDSAYEISVKVYDAEMASINITCNQLHPEWNYTIKPRQ